MLCLVDYQPAPPKSLDIQVVPRPDAPTALSSYWSSEVGAQSQGSPRTCRGPGGSLERQRWGLRCTCASGLSTSSALTPPNLPGVACQTNLYGLYSQIKWPKESQPFSSPRTPGAGTLLFLLCAVWWCWMKQHRAQQGACSLGAKRLGQPPCQEPRPDFRHHHPAYHRNRPATVTPTTCIPSTCILDAHPVPGSTVQYWFTGRVPIHWETDISDSKNAWNG